MSSRGFVRISNLITPAHHAFDPLSKQEALDLVAGFGVCAPARALTSRKPLSFLTKPHWRSC
jgi:hypothetical protein